MPLRDRNFMNKFEIFFKCTDEYHKNLEESLSELCNQWDSQSKCKNIPRAFADFVVQNAYLSVNLYDEGIQQFLEAEELPTRDEIADRKYRHFGSSPHAEMETRSGHYSPYRNAFDANVKDAREIRYLTLTIPNNSLGNTRYGDWHCLTKAKYKELEWKNKVRFLRHNSLHDKHGYVIEKEDRVKDIDRDRLTNESGCWECVHFIAALKFKDFLADKSQDEWVNLFPDPNDPKDHIEALTKEKIPPTEFIVRIKKKDYQWCLDREVEEDEPSERFREPIETFLRIYRLLVEKNVEVEQV